MMKKTLTLVMIIASLLAKSNDITVAPDPLVQRLKKEQFQKLPPSEKRKYLQRLSYINNGGHLIKENTGRGIVKILVASKKVNMDLLRISISKIERLMKVNTEVLYIDNKNVSVENALKLKGEQKANIAVFVIENSKLPRLLSAPEEGWSIVNIDSLINSSEKVIFNRINKEVIRATSLATGCANVGGCMQQVVDVNSLDALISDSFPINMRAQIYKSIESFGIEPRIEASYKVACQQGWAPAPTNDIQKAIWDKVHAAPKNPIKIEFDPKKGR
jgi:hypothetical protein